MVLPLYRLQKTLSLNQPKAFICKIAIMQQLQLFEANHFNQRIETNSVKAVFTEIKKACFDVVLEISSNKFLIKVREFAGKIEAFEIVAIKSFMELTQKTVALLRQITQHFFCRLER